jgi:phosphoglucomutase
LRKKVKVFQQPNYLENFVQALFDALKPEEYQGKALVIAGDGRYHNDVAIQIILRIAAANGVRRVYVGQNGLISTPAASALIRRLNEDNGADYCVGGILLTASHNPAGEHEDFGIKFNSSNGGPALEAYTNRVFDITKTISQYKLVDFGRNVSIDTVQVHELGTVEGFTQFTVEIIDST